MLFRSFDDDGFVASDVTHDVSIAKGASDSVDPPIFYGNNDKSIF